MVMLQCFFGLSLLSGVVAASTEVTPMETVISLLENLLDEVRSEGKEEEEAYTRFACFCKETTLTKTNGTHGVYKQHDLIATNAADIAEKTQSQRDLSTKLGERKRKQEKLSSDLDDTNARCAKDKAQYQAEAADLSKAIQGLEDAIEAMKGSKPSLLQIQSRLKETLGMAEVMGSPRAHSVMSLL